MGAKLRVVDHGFVSLFKRMREIKGGYAKVGVLDSKAGGGDQHDDKGGLTTAEIAAILEYGTQDGHIPARPALRAAFNEQRPELVEMGKELMKQVLEGKSTIEKSLNVMGAKLATETKKKITEGEGIQPPLAESTIKRKGSSRPWVDTGRVLNAFTWAVKKKGEE